MAVDTYPQALSLVLRYEGGYVNNPRDPGGPTNLGVTQATLSAWLGRHASIKDVMLLHPADVAPIYKKQYWDKISGDDLPAGLDYAVFDYAVNSGIVRAARDLQEVLGVYADGHIGLETVAACRGKDVAVLIGQLCDRRLAFMRRLRTWSTFGRGWSVRVAGVRSHAMNMIHLDPAPAPKPVESAPAAPAPEVETPPAAPVPAQEPESKPAEVVVEPEKAPGEPAPDPAPVHVDPPVEAAREPPKPVVILPADATPATADGMSAKANPEDQSALSTTAAQAGGITGVGAVGGVLTNAAQQIQPLADYADYAKWLFIFLTVAGIGISIYLALKQSRDPLND